jgi:nitrogen fixation NifU-like protein
MADEQLYREMIIESYKHPAHKGNLSSCTHEGGATNPTCGDEFSMQIMFKDDIITDIAFDGAGCAISTASMDFLAGFVKGKTFQEAQSISKDDIFKMLVIPISHGRITCALLPLDALQDTLQHAKNN